jgi:predicted amidophosphoribosyltransferase
MRFQLPRARLGAYVGNAAWRPWRQAGGLIRGPLNLLYPQVCAYCGTDLIEPTRDRLCGECRGRLAPPTSESCRRCGATVPEHSGDAPDCAHCRGRRLHFDAVIALGRYEGDLRLAVLRMKHAAEEPLSTAMGCLLAEQRGERIAALRPDLVVAVPMHWSRRMFRGTNTPAVLAQQLGGR